MELTIYDIIQGPVVSDKAYQQNQRLQKLVLDVHMHANKPLVQEAVEKLFGVHVAKVAILVRKGKRRMTKARTVTQGKDCKRAIVTLKAGYSINLFGDVTAKAQTTVASQPVEQNNA
ncbi:MAG: 50S ribosomal protein L23 [Candidatus Chromulinivorax sp.]